MFLPAIRRTSTWISLLLAAASSALPVCALGQSNSFPKFVVADVRDVTIKTRRTFDVPSSTIETDVLFLKRGRQRGEQSLRFPVASSSTLRAGRSPPRRSKTSLNMRTAAARP
ncbi:MAG: hypothetical protein DMF90_29375 [Acidobacteria bacterium]|nr:MAG: hypothetical protein DMF90_29375 [Acidobacteriota bacterium]